MNEKNGKRTCYFLNILCFLGGIWNGCVAYGSCVAGDGPSPILDISQILYESVREIPSAANQVEELLLWERAGKVIFRNTGYQISSLDLKDMDSIHSVTALASPLSVVKDGTEQYLAAEGQIRVYDTKKDLWYNTLPLEGKITHLFWYRGKLYSLATKMKSSLENTFSIMEYIPGERKANEICSHRTKALKNFSFAIGHMFPEVSLYRVTPLDRDIEKNQVSIYTLNVRDCSLVKKKNHEFEVPGEVKTVAVYPSLDSVGIQFEHAKKNFLWHEKEHGCRYYDLPTQAPVFFSNKYPMVAFLNDTRGFSLIEFNNHPKLNTTAAKFLRDLPIKSISAGKVAITQGASQIFMSPTLINGDKRLLQVEWKKK